MRIGQRLKNEGGAVIVVVTAALVALLLSVAVVADIGLLYQERRQLQTSTDAAALAAAMDISEGRSIVEAKAEAVQYVSVNANVAPRLVDVGFPAVDRVRVVAQTERRIFFSGLVGQEAALVKAESTAAMGSANGVAKLVPFIVPLQKVQDHSGASRAGSFELGEDRPLEAFSKLQTINGDTITYAITYNNTGNKSESVSVRDPLPDGTVYINGSADSGGSYSASTKEVTWSFANVAPGDYRIMRFAVRATSGSVGTIKNTAYLTTLGNNKTIAADTGNSAQRGYFWLCDFDGGSNGIPQYDEWIRKGFPDYVYAGSIANGTGMKVVLKDAMEWRRQSDPSIVVPVYSYTQGGGSKGKYQVIGFAEFVITGFDFSGQPKTITGYFTDGTVVSGVQGSAPDAYFGVDTVWLVK